MGCFKILLFVFLAFLSVPMQAQSPKADSLLKVLPEEIGDIRFELLSQLYCEGFKYDVRMAKNYLDLRQTDASFLKDSLRICENLIGYGALNILEGNLQEAEKILLKAIRIAKRHNYDFKLKMIYNELILLYNQTGAYDKALEYNFKSLERRKLDGNALEVSIAYNNLGLTYENLKDYNKALEFYLEALNLKEREKLTWGYVIALANISGIYNIQGRYGEGLEYVLKAKAFCESGCIPNDIWVMNKSLGESYLFLDSLNKAEFHFLKSLTVSLESNIKGRVPESYIYLAKVEMKRSNPNRAIQYLNEANNVLKSNYRATSQLTVYELYAEAYKKTKNYKLMASNLEAYKELESEIYNGDLTKNVSGISVSLIEENSKATIDTQKELLLLKEQSIQQQRIIAIISVAVTALLVVVAVMLWFGLKTRGRINQVLNRKVKMRTRELNIRNDELNRTTFEQSMVLEKLNQQLQAFSATLSGLVHTASQDIGDPAARSYFEKLESEIVKVRNKTKMFGLQKLKTDSDFAQLKEDQSQQEPVSID